MRRGVVHRIATLARFELFEPYRLWRRRNATPITNFLAGRLNDADLRRQIGRGRAQPSALAGLADPIQFKAMLPRLSGAARTGRKPGVARFSRTIDPSGHNGASFAQLEPDVGHARTSGPPETVAIKPEAKKVTSQRSWVRPPRHKLAPRGLVSIRLSAPGASRPTSTNGFVTGWSTGATAVGHAVRPGILRE